MCVVHSVPFVCCAQRSLCLLLWLLRNSLLRAAQVTHSANGTTVSFLDVVDVSKPQKVAVLLDKAMQQRAVGATAVNEHSSRSHFVFMLQIDGVNERRQQEVHGTLLLLVVVMLVCERQFLLDLS